MRRDLRALSESEFDLLVLGGGAFGAAAAWDASLRGLRVALLEQADFGSGASAECFKMVHGGIRYLQHADIGRLRASCHERSALLRIAPHLVKPLPIVVPTFGGGRRGKALLGAGMYVYDALTLGRNAGIRDASRRIAATRFLSRSELLDLFPEQRDPALTGAAVFEDGQMYNAARLVLAFVASAAAKGAVVANYVQARRLLWEGDAVTGVEAYDCLEGERFDVRARLTLNAAGPWAEYLLDDPARFGSHQRGHFSRDAYFVINRRPRSPYALAVPGHSRDRDSLVNRTARHLFAVPWRDYTLIGVWHRPFPDRPDATRIDEAELEGWMDEMNQSQPALQLRREEICYACCGLVPFGSGTATPDELSFGKESRYIDHRSVNGVKRLLTLIGIRFTTARGDAARAVDLLLRQWSGRSPGRARTERIALLGGDIDDFPALLSNALTRRPAALSARSIEALIHNHGTGFRDVLAIAADSTQQRGVGQSDTLIAELTHAVRMEMAMTLEDVVLRRTNLGSGAHPGRQVLEQVADRLQPLLGWSQQRRDRELQATEAVLRRHHAAEAGSLSDGRRAAGALP